MCELCLINAEMETRTMSTCKCGKNKKPMADVCPKCFDQQVKYLQSEIDRVGDRYLHLALDSDLFYLEALTEELRAQLEKK